MQFLSESYKTLKDYNIQQNNLLQLKSRISKCFLAGGGSTESFAIAVRGMCAQMRFSRAMSHKT